MTSSQTTRDPHETSLDQVNEAVGQMTFGQAVRPTRGQAHANAPRIKRLVVAYDGSDGAQRALDWAKDLAQSYGASVTVVSVFSPPQLASAGAMGYAWYPDYADAYGAMERGTRKAADDATELLRELHVDATSVVAAGSAGREIARIAAEKSADIVIVGATRNGRVKRALLGSTATTLLDHAPCSVLVARGTSRPPRILVATDGSHAGYRAVAHALHRASQTGAELIVQHVLEYPMQNEDEEPPEGSLKAVAQRLKLPAAPPRVRYVLDVGGPATRILLRSSEEDAGLVVLGSHGKDVIDRLFVGSTSRRVANQSHASVLVVKDA